MVTGGARRLGSAISQALTANGYRVVLHCFKSLEEAKKLADSLDAGLVQGDLSRLEDVETLFAKATAVYGRIDHVVNNASAFTTLSIENTDIATYNLLMALHSGAPFFLSKQLYLQVKARGGRGSVINIIDSKVHNPSVSRPAYYCSKGALLEQTRALAVALAPYVRVNAISPGPLLSNGDDAYFTKMETMLPLRKTGSEEDLCQAVLYLMRAPFVTAMDLAVDGGQRLL